VNGRGRVEVPENAVRSEPIAFGLSAVQLLLCGAGVAVGALLNLLPLWVPAKAVLLAVVVGPVVLAAVLPIGGEPAYRWLLRAARYARGRRVWRAELAGAESGTTGPGEAANKPGISARVQALASPPDDPDGERGWQAGDNTATTAQGGPSSVPPSGVIWARLLAPAEPGAQGPPV
jgi:hypothetical protein